MHHPTAYWPRVPRPQPLRHHPADGQPDDTGTRLDLQALSGPGAAALAEPTRPVRTVPAPPVKPIPREAREARKAHAAAAPARPANDPVATGFIEKVLADQAQLNRDHSRRMDAIVRRGPRGVFGWRPLAAPSLREVAAARALIAQREERRRHRHARRMDRLEVAKGWLVVLCLFALLGLIVAMGIVAAMILHGDFTWAPVRQG